MLRKLRFWAKTFLCADLMLSVAWYAVVGVFSTVALVVAFNRGDEDQVLGLFGSVLTAATVLGFGWWVTRDARKTYRQIRRQRQSSEMPHE